MQVYIDESGNFAGYHEGSISVVGALCIPHSSSRKLFDKYSRLRLSLPQENGEVKGRLLSERDIDQVIQLLCRNQAIYEVTAMDIGAHNAQGVIDYRNGIADYMDSIKERFNITARQEVARAIAQIRRTEPPLFLQAMATIDVLQTTLEHVPLYFVQREPRELGAFQWICDAKDRIATTDWEQWWSTYCQGVLATRSIRKPGPRLEGADYSYFEVFDGDCGNGERGTDLKLLLSDIQFSSDVQPGLELVDIVTNAVRRALKGNLAAKGWQRIPKTMIHRRHNYISLLLLEGASTEPRNPKYADVVKAFMAGGKSMLTPSVREIAARS